MMRSPVANGYGNVNNNNPFVKLEKEPGSRF